MTQQFQGLGLLNSGNYYGGNNDMAISVRAVQNGWVVEVTSVMKITKKPKIVTAKIKDKGAKAPTEALMEMDYSVLDADPYQYGGAPKKIETHVFSFNEKPAMMKLISESLIECSEG